MPDKKLTDKEIIKALEYCTNCVCNNDKDECPLLKMSFCKNYLMKQSLDLINRLQAKLDEAEDTIQFADKELKKAEAKNERLKENLNIELENFATEYDNKIKAEAYKEFAERLKEKYGYYNWEDKEIVYPEEEIDNLLKELAGEDQ